MRNFLIAIILVSIIPSAIQAQCNSTSRAGYHIVQPGENLYRISLKYGVKMAQICAWNDIKIDEVLSSCKELRVSSNYARLTSYNTDQLAEKGVPSTSAYSPPAQVISSNAPYTPTPNTHLTPLSNPTPVPSTNKSIEIAERQTGKRHTVQYGETVASIAAAYGYTPKRLREINVMRAEEEVNEGSILLTSDCGCEILPRTEIVSTGTTTSSHNPVSEYSTKGGNTSTSSTTNTTNKTSTSFMQSEEQAMVDEINLMRSNPGAYAKFVRAYLEKGKSGKGFPTNETTVNELIAELNRTSPLSQLQVTECIYNAARKHGVDELSRGKTGHVGTDGSYPWDRVIKECPQMREGGENLVGGPSEVRDAVIMLLIDEGIANRGHRRTLLNKDWKYVACYKIGKVGSMPNCWVQNFGY